MANGFSFAPKTVLALIAIVITLLALQTALQAQGLCSSCNNDSIGWGYWTPNVICTNAGIDTLCDTITSNPSFLAYTTQDTVPGTWKLEQYGVGGTDSILNVAPTRNCLTIVVPIWFCNQPVDSISFKFCIPNVCGPIRKSMISYTPADSSNPIPGNGGFNYTSFSPGPNGYCFQLTGIAPVIDSFPIFDSIAPHDWVYSGRDTIANTCYDQDFTFTICPWDTSTSCSSAKIELTCTTYHDHDTCWDQTTHLPGPCAPYIMMTADSIGVLSGEHWNHLIIHPKNSNIMPMALILYPNPATNTPFETIEYTAMEDGPIAVCLYNSNGKEVSTIQTDALKGVQTSYKLPFDDGYPDGMYICRIMQPHSIASKTLAVIR